MKLIEILLFYIIHFVENSTECYQINDLAYTNQNHRMLKNYEITSELLHPDWCTKIPNQIVAQLTKYLWSSGWMFQTVLVEIIIRIIAATVHNTT